MEGKSAGERKRVFHTTSAYIITTSAQMTRPTTAHLQREAKKGGANLSANELNGL